MSEPDMIIDSGKYEELKLQGATTTTFSTTSSPGKIPAGTSVGVSRMAGFAFPPKVDPNTLRARVSQRKPNPAKSNSVIVHLELE